MLFSSLSSNRDILDKGYKTASIISAERCHSSQDPADTPKKITNSGNEDCSLCTKRSLITHTHQIRLNFN